MNILVLGMTESGKTTLAKRLAREYHKKGIPVLVLDALGDEWGKGSKKAPVTVFDDQDVFIQQYWKTTGSAVFIDEAGDEVGRYNDLMIRTATRGRHNGHNNHYLSQRGTMLSPTVRDQCSNLYLFTTHGKDAKQHALEWNAPVLETANELPQGSCFAVTRYGDARLIEVFKPRRKAKSNESDILNSGTRSRRAGVSAGKEETGETETG